MQTIPPDRDPDKFVEEEEWLEEYMLSSATDAHLAQNETHHQGSDTPFGYAPHGPDAGGDAVSTLLQQRPQLLAYIGGFFTCLLVLALCWTGFSVERRIRRNQRGYGYVQVDKHDHEDDHGLNVGSEQGPGCGNHAMKPEDHVNPL